MAEGDPAEYADINVAGLRELLAARGLPTAGRRAELIARLTKPPRVVAKCIPTQVHRVRRHRRRRFMSA